MIEMFQNIFLTETSHGVTFDKLEGNLFTFSIIYFFWKEGKISICFNILKVKNHTDLRQKISVKTVCTIIKYDGNLHCDTSVC